MRRIISLLLAVVLLLIGCGAQSGENQTARTGEETEQQWGKTYDKKDNKNNDINSSYDVNCISFRANK